MHSYTTATLHGLISLHGLSERKWDNRTGSMDNGDNLENALVRIGVGLIPFKWPKRKRENSWDDVSVSLRHWTILNDSLLKSAKISYLFLWFENSLWWTGDLTRVYQILFTSTHKKKKKKKIKPLLSFNLLELLVHTLIFSCLDYCNSLFNFASLSPS